MSMIAPFPQSPTPAVGNPNRFQMLLPKPVAVGANETITDARNIFCQIRRIINDYNDTVSSYNEKIIEILKTEIKSNMSRLARLLKNASISLSEAQIDDIEALRNEGKVLLSELGQPEVPYDLEDMIDNPQIDEETIKEINAQLVETKKLFSKLLNPETITSNTLHNYILTRKNICNELMDKKSVIEQLMEQDGLRHNNYSILVLIKEFERTLQMITEATYQLEAAEEKYYALGDLQATLDMVKEEIEEKDLTKPRIAEKIRQHLEKCQDMIDAFEVVCNNLTAQLSELAAISGDAITSKEADYLIELQGYKCELHEAREKFEKALIKPEIKKIETKDAFTFTPGGKIDKDATFKPLLPSNSNTLTQRPVSKPAITEPQSPVTYVTPEDIPELILAPAKPLHQKVVYSRFVQFLLGFLSVFVLGYCLISLLAERPAPNNWRKQYGPQLDYNYLPPS